MKQPRQTPHAAIALLLAGIALPLNPALSQDATTAEPPVVNAPPPVTAPAPPPPIVNAPAPVASPPPRAQALPAPPPPRAAEPIAEPAPARIRSASRPAERRAEAPPRAAPVEAAPAAEAAPAPAQAAPVAAAPAEPAAAEPAPGLPVAGEAAMPEQSGADRSAALLWLIGAVVLTIAALAAFALLRRRRRTDEAYHEESYVEAPVHDTNEAPGLSAPAAFAAAVPLAAAAPLTAAAPYDAVAVEQAAEPAASSVDKMAVGAPDAADVEALAAASRAPAGRPWLEFLLRPVRAGTTGDDTVVEFELTVGNTGSVPARDVRISTWMFAAGSAAESEMERMLIAPPAGAQREEVSIPAGDGARVEAALALPKTGRDEAVLPVVVADARYTLPDGSEGRTSASFEIGLPAGETLEPFPTDRASGLLETVEARLHGDLERV